LNKEAWRTRLRSAGPDLVGLAWVVGAALATLLPALLHGSALGSFDVLSLYGLSKRSGTIVHNPQAYDQITQMIPWSNLSWSQVHQGHLPLWDRYEALGMPLAFNWQTSSFSLSTLVGYLFPVRLAYTVATVCNLVIAGTGAYVVGRVMRLGVLGCVVAGTVYELSGPFMAWLGWPIAGVMAWSGWLFAATIVIVRGQRRFGGALFLAVSVAGAVYAGQPEILVILAGALAVFVVVVLGLRRFATWGSGPVLRPALDLAAGGLAGAALGAPLLLPGAQLLSKAVRTGKGGGAKAVPLGYLVELVDQTYHGLPIDGRHMFGILPYYQQTALYVGVIGLVLATVAVAWAFSNRRGRGRTGQERTGQERTGQERTCQEVVGLAAVAVVTALVAFFPLVEAALSTLPAVGHVLWRRADLVMAFALAVLAGAGTDVIVKSRLGPPVRKWASLTLGSIACLLFLWWLVDRGHLTPADASVRDRSFIWPVAQVIFGFLVIGGAGLLSRRWGSSQRAGWGYLDIGRIAAGSLLVCETAFLVTAGMPLFSSSPAYIAPTAAERALQRTVGSSLVGMGTDDCFDPQQLGIVPNFNVALRVQELEMYDPLFPRAYATAWRDATGQSSRPPVRPGQPFSLYCPAVSSASVARLYGVGFLLEPDSAGAPHGTVFVSKIGDEDIYRVPGSAAATLTRLSSDGSLPPEDAPGVPVGVSDPDPASWKVSVSTSTPQVLRLRLTDVPGWHATIDGRTVPLQRFAGVMLQLRVPAGHHVVVIRYWPTAFSVGLIVGACGVGGLTAAGIVAWVRRRRTRHRSSPQVLRDAVLVGPRRASSH
jgi:Bacterial membrane protein YfhO